MEGLSVGSLGSLVQKTINGYKTNLKEEGTVNKSYLKRTKNYLKTLKPLTNRLRVQESVIIVFLVISLHPSPMFKSLIFDSVRFKTSCYPKKEFTDVGSSRTRL